MSDARETLNDEFSREEFSRALHMIGKNSAPGLDKVDYPMIKNLPYIGKITLLNFFNEIWHGGGKDFLRTG